MSDLRKFQGAVSRSMWTLAVCLLTSSAGQLVAGEPIRLVPNRPAGEISQVEVVLQVGGDLLLAQPGKAPTEATARKLPMSVAARLVYDELPVITAGQAAGTQRALRHYQAAKALVEIEGGRMEPQLSEPHRLIAVETSQPKVVLTCPRAPLTREELDLIDIPANSLLLESLLPSEPVSPGDTWKSSDELIAALLRLDAVSLCEVQSMLAEVDTTENVAKVSLAGTVQGGIAGVATEIEIKAKYTFDLNLKRIILFALLVKEKRSIGHVGTGFDTVAKQIIKIRPNSTSETLRAIDASAVAAWFAPQAEQLAFASAHNGFRLEHNRRWFITADDKRLTVFRFVDRGEFVAQCNLTLLPESASNNQLDLAAFQKDIEKSLGKQFGQFVSAKETTDAVGRRVYRVVVSGTASGLPIQWVYYLFATRDGTRLSAVFSVEQPLIERFGSADQEFLRSLEIVPPQTAAGSREDADRR